MAAELTVTGGELSTATVGSAVWSYAIAAGFTAERIQRIIMAAVAGESSGGPNAPEYEGPDGIIMVSGDVDVGTGDRSNVVYGD